MPALPSRIEARLGQAAAKDLAIIAAEVREVLTELGREPNGIDE